MFIAPDPEQVCTVPSCARRAHRSHAPASRLRFVTIGCSETRTFGARLVLNTCIRVRLLIQTGVGDTEDGLRTRGTACITRRLWCRHGESTSTPRPRGKHRRDRTTGPVGRVPSNFGEHETGTKCIWSPPTSATGCHFFAGQCRKLTVLPKTWLNLKGEKERRMGKGMGETWVEQ